MSCLSSDSFENTGSEGMEEEGSVSIFIIFFVDRCLNILKFRNSQTFYFTIFIKKIYSANVIISLCEIINIAIIAMTRVLKKL
jgi:hypothetical protein